MEPFLVDSQEPDEMGFPLKLKLPWSDLAAGGAGARREREREDVMLIEPPPRGKGKRRKLDRPDVVIVRDERGASSGGGNGGEDVIITGSSDKRKRQGKRPASQPDIICTQVTEGKGRGRANVKLRTILAVFPDATPAYVQGLLTKLKDDAQHVVNHMEKHSFPKAPRRPTSLDEAGPANKRPSSKGQGAAARPTPQGSRRRVYRCGACGYHSKKEAHDCADELRKQHGKVGGVAHDAVLKPTAGEDEIIRKAMSQRHGKQLRGQEDAADRDPTPPPPSAVPSVAVAADLMSQTGASVDQATVDEIECGCCYTECQFGDMVRLPCACFEKRLPVVCVRVSLLPSPRASTVF